MTTLGRYQAVEVVVGEGLVILVFRIVNPADVAQGIVVIGKMGKTRLARCLGILQAVVAIYEAGGRMGGGRSVVEVEGVISASSMQARTSPGRLSRVSWPRWL